MHQTLYVYTAWHMDEVCNGLYLTCIDPLGKTIAKVLVTRDVQVALPRVVLSSVHLDELWYTVEGFYTFTLSHCFNEMPYLPSSSFRIELMQGYT